jgi:hypothetical protein
MSGALPCTGSNTTYFQPDGCSGRQRGPPTSLLADVAEASVLGPVPLEVDARIQVSGVLAITTRSTSGCSFRTGTGDQSPTGWGNRANIWVSINAYPNFKVTAPGAQLPSRNWTWTAHLNSVAFDSIGLPFHIGKLRTNSERKNDCDTMWAEFRQLDDCSSVTGGSCNWHGSYVNLQCFKTVSGGQYRFNRIDNTRHTVPQTGGVTC